MSFLLSHERLIPCINFPYTGFHELLSKPFDCLKELTQLSGAASSNCYICIILFIHWMSLLAAQNSRQDVDPIKQQRQSWNSRHREAWPLVVVISLEFPFKMDSDLVYLFIVHSQSFSTDSDDPFTSVY